MFGVFQCFLGIYQKKIFRDDLTYVFHVFYPKSLLSLGMSMMKYDDLTLASPFFVGFSLVFVHGFQGFFSSTVSVAFAQKTPR